MPVTHLNSLIEDVSKIDNPDSLEHMVDVFRIYDKKSVTQQANIDTLYSVHSTTFQELFCRKVIHFVPHKDKNKKVKDEYHVGGDIVIAYVLNTLSSINNSNRPKVDNDKNIIKSCSYDRTSIIKKCEELGLDYSVKRLEKEGLLTRYLIGIYVNSVKDDSDSEESTHENSVDNCCSEENKDEDKHKKVTRNFDNVEDICSAYNKFLSDNEDFFSRRNPQKYCYVFSTYNMNLYNNNDIERRISFFQGTNKESSLMITYSTTLGNFRDTDANNLIMKYFKQKVSNTCLQLIDAGLLFSKTSASIEVEDLNQFFVDTIYIV